MSSSTIASIKKKQQGVVLVFSLLILTALTLVAVTGMKTTIIQEKMSGNLRDSELAHQAAESAMLDAQTFLDGLTSQAPLTNTNGLLRKGSDAGKNELDYFSQDTWDPASPSNYTTASSVGSGQLSELPKFIIKHLGRTNICDGEDNPWDPNNSAATSRCFREVFKITAHGTGLSPDTTKILQAYYEIDAF